MHARSSPVSVHECLNDSLGWWASVRGHVGSVKLHDLRVKIVSCEGYRM